MFRLNSFITMGGRKMSRNIILNDKGYISTHSDDAPNIIGYIPGKNDSEYIFLGAHYDGFFHSYQDDALGVGIILAIAKAIIDSGQRPEYTIGLIMHGAEEFGASDSHYDWCTGSWNQTTNMENSDWLDKIKLFANIDAVNPDKKDCLVQASPELHDFFEDLFTMRQYESGKWYEKYNVEDVGGPWSDDYSYFMKGIPIVICGRGKSQWRSNHYHTQFDNSEMLDVDFCQNISELYMLILSSFDESSVKSFKYEKILDMYLNSLRRDVLEKCDINVSKLLDKINSCREKILSVMKKVENKNYNGINTEYVNVLEHVNTMMIEKLRGLNLDDEIIFSQEDLQENYEYFSSLEYALNAGKEQKASQIMSMLFGYSIISKFSEEVYKHWCLDVFCPQKKKLFWGDKRINAPVDIMNLYRQFTSEQSNGNCYKNTLNELSKLKKENCSSINEKINEHYELFITIEAKLKSILEGSKCE